MINLLSPTDRKELSAARTNTLLLRYNMLLGMVVVVLLIEMAGIYFVLNLSRTSDQSTIAENNAKTATYETTKIAAEQFKSDLSNAKVILGNQVKYTKLTTMIANILPADARLDALALNPETFGTPTSLTIYTKSYQSAIDVKQYLQKSPIFEDVNFQSVAQAETAGAEFSFTAIYNVTISKEAATL